MLATAVKDSLTAVALFGLNTMETVRVIKVLLISRSPLPPSCIPGKSSSHLIPVFNTISSTGLSILMMIYLCLGEHLDVA
jgi:hypothetical protein